MGIYLNPGNEGFGESIRSKIYVDKTGLISQTNRCLNTEQKYFCVSRPRRFGKTMALEMLAAYYGKGCDSRELFRGLNIETDPSFEDNLNKYDVIYLNTARFLYEARGQNVIEYLTQRVLGELCEEFGEYLTGEERWLSIALRHIYAETGREFVFLIDEWDCITRERQEEEEMQRQYYDFLRDLLKDEPYVALAYVTGILPVKKFGVHSGLNMFTEYSMTHQWKLAEYTGFTEDEVKGLCKRFSMDFDEVCRWYDGYQLDSVGHVFSPVSVVNAMLSRRCSNYWTATETYEALKRYIDLDFNGLREDIVRLLGGERVRVNTWTFQNDMQTFRRKDDVLTLLIHLGYLAYDAEDEKVVIPNSEIADEFKTAISAGGWDDVASVFKDSKLLLENTLRGNEKEVAEALDKAHEVITSNLDCNREDSLVAILLAYWSARKNYKIIWEMLTECADILFLPLKGTDTPAIVVELKFDKTAKGALQQMKDKKYSDTWENYSGEVILVGINCNRANKRSCTIERVKKEETAGKLNIF